MYNFRKVEKKWQEYWDENKTFKTDIKISVSQNIMP